MGDRTIKESAMAFAVKHALSYMDSDPEKNVPKLLEWLEKHDVGGKAVTNQVRTIRAAFHDPENNWHKLIDSFWTDVNDLERRRILEGAVINGSLIGAPRQRENEKKYGCSIPWAILMDPTSACNLHCTGCWAAEYGNRLNLSLEELDSIIQQGKKLGIFIYIYSGGEPLVRKGDIIRLCEMHPECAFLAFTNGTLIDEDFAAEMERVGNFLPAISVEGFEKETDERRGAGTYKAVVRAMEILKAHKLLFGASCCYTSRNTETIGSEAYIDDLVARGCKFAWFFTYMPVGVDAVPELLATAEQRKFMYDQVRAFRNTKPIFTLDFWNDGEYVDGCIAGGRRYLHINANGDVEPCAFIHYSDSNIKEKSLLEALQAPLFMAYHNGQPFNSNHLRPCPLLDNPGALAEMVDKSGARSTDLQHPEDVHDLSAKCKAAAEHWSPVAEELWAKTPKRCHNCSQWDK